MILRIQNINIQFLWILLRSKMQDSKIDKLALYGSKTIRKS